LALNLASFDPKAPPPKTGVFWAISTASRAPEDAELADVLDRLGLADAVTIARITSAASGSFAASPRRSEMSAIEGEPDSAQTTPLPSPAPAACPVEVTMARSRSRTLFRKAFHIEGNDDLRWVSLTYALQVFQIIFQLGSRLL